MKCPHCRDALEVFEFETLDENKQKIKIRLDRCNSCDGTWFDRGELCAFTGIDLTGHKLSDRTPALYSKCPECGEDNSRQMTQCPSCQGNLRHLCPRCHEELEHVKFLGVFVDYCSDCYGMWLDSGEASSIAESAQADHPSGEITCANCGKTGFNLRNTLCTAKGQVCESCFEEIDEQEDAHDQWHLSYEEGEGGMVEVFDIIRSFIRTKRRLKKLSKKE